MSKLDELIKQHGILDTDKLSKDIEDMRLTTENYLEAIVQYGELHNIEFTTFKSLLSPQIITKLTKEMQDLHLINKSSTNTLDF